MAVFGLASFCTSSQRELNGYESIKVDPKHDLPFWLPFRPTCNLKRYETHCNIYAPFVFPHLNHFTCRDYKPYKCFTLLSYLTHHVLGSPKIVLPPPSIFLGGPMKGCLWRRTTWWRRRVTWRRSIWASAPPAACRTSSGSARRSPPEPAGAREVLDSLPVGRWLFWGGLPRMALVLWVSRESHLQKKGPQK